MAKISDEQFDAGLEEEWPTLNRKARRAVKFRREQMKAIMATSPTKNYRFLTSAGGVFDNGSTGEDAQKQDNK